MRSLELFDLTGKTALVTGGGRGIGRHIAAGLAEAGARVAIASRKLANLEEAAAEIRATGGDVLIFETDLAADGAPEALAEAVIAEAGRVDVLVNNSGRVWAAPTLEYPADGWDRVFDLNVRSLFLLSREIGVHMKDAGGGVIINVASISAFKGSREETQPVVAYNASKGAVVSLTRDLAVKLASHGIRVNAIAPGSFLTDMTNYVSYDEEKLARFNSTIPLGRSGEADDIKGVAVFLASDASSFMTGEIVVVDGGTMACDPWPVMS